MDSHEKGNLSFVEIKRRIKSSFLTLTARQIALRAISFITINVILARILPVETLGIFNIAAAVVTFFAYFSDIGLAASLIQKKDKVEHEDIKTTFTIQQSLVGFLSLSIIFLAPYIAEFYKLNQDGVWLIRILSLGLFLTSLKVIPSVMLERNLNFQPLVLVEILETVVFNFLLILLVYSNFGIWGFIYASFARSVLGVLAIYLIAPVKIGIGINKISAERLLTFGVPFQLNSLLALFKDRLVPLVIARMIGPVGIGYITWSQSLAFLPLEIMNIVIRITFPAFSRLQEDKENLTKAVEKSLFASALVVYPVLFGIAALLPSLIKYVVSSKWEPALISFYFFAFSTYWALISTTFTNTLNAVGQIKLTLRLMVLWTALTWVMTPILTYFLGFNGVGLASFLISFTSILTIFYIKKILTIKVLDSIILPTTSSAVMALVIYLFSEYFVRNIFTLAVSIILGALIYSGIILLLGRKRIIEDIKSLKNA